MYSLYHCYHQLESAAIDVSTDVEEFNRLVSLEMPEFFNIPQGKLPGVRFGVNTQADFCALVNEIQSNRPYFFLMPAERNGLHLFFRELSTRRTALLHHASKENINISELLRDVIRSRYAAPIAHYIDWLNTLTEIQRESASDFHIYAEQLKKELAQGAYTVDKSSGSIEFKPYQIRRDGRKTQRMGLHAMSGTVKSLFGLWFYLEHQARKGDFLMIDEPELNIHPENQRKISKLLARLVNAGLRIVISTHSDYMVREFNSLIMLNQDDTSALTKKHNYQDSEILNPDQVGAYLFDDQTITPFEITPEDGIYATTFDRVIRDINAVNDDIYYSLQERELGRQEG